MEEKERKAKAAHYLNLDLAFAGVEILRIHLIAPFLVPVELGGNIGPKTSGILDGSFIHLQVLMIIHKEKELSDLESRI